MSKLSDAWMTLKLYGVNPRDAKDRQRGRKDAEAFLQACPNGSACDVATCEEARDVLAALDAVEACLGARRN